MARSLNEWLWQHEFWLPPGITWEDMQESEDVHYPQPRDLLLSVPFALILVVIRCAFESWRFTFHIICFFPGLAVLYTSSATCCSA